VTDEPPWGDRVPTPDEVERWEAQDPSKYVWQEDDVEDVLGHPGLPTEDA
jgi:hypothetical protein